MKFTLASVFIWFICPTLISSKAQQPHVLFVALPWRGHVNPLRVLAKQLVAKGFAVSFAVPSEAREWVHEEGVDVIPLPSTLGIRRDFGEPQAGRAPGLRTLITTLALYHQKMLHPLLLHVLQNRPGLIVVDRFSLAGLHVAQSLNIPVILNSPHLLLLMDQPPLYIPTPLSFLEYYPSSLLERVLNLYHRARYRLDWIQAQTNVARMEIGSTNFSSYQPFNLDYSRAIILVNTVFGLEYPRPLEPRFKMTGPLLDTPDPLGARLQEWLDHALQSEVAVIYVNLGEDVTLETHEVEALLEGLTLGKQRILWSMPKSKRFLLPKVLPPSVRWNSFVPQMSVLAHGAVKLFVTHCGLTGVQEALIHAIPILALPSFIDQWEVGLRVAQQQAGLVLDRRELNPNKVNMLAEELLGNTTYTQKAEELAAILAQAGGTKEAVRIIDLAYRVGNVYLHQDSSMNWVQDNFWDVKAVYCVVLALMGYVLSVCWSTLLGLWETNSELSLSTSPLS